MSDDAETPLRCWTDDGHEWCVEARMSPVDEHGRQRRIHVLESTGPNLKTREVPLVLSLGSRLRYGWLGTWPPERASRLYAEGESVIIEYRDEWIPFERPILPFGYDRECEWRAQFDPRQRTWSLKRLRHLDYDSEGHP
jgi:hypothetical protein